MQIDCWWLSGKESACYVWVVGSIPGLAISPGGGNGNPLQYSCLVNPMDGGAWWATFHGVEELDTTERLNHHTQTDCIRLSSKMWFFIHLALCPRSAYYPTTMRRINVQKWLNLMYAKYVYCYSLLCVPFLINPHEGKILKQWKTHILRV